MPVTTNKLRAVITLGFIAGDTFEATLTIEDEDVPVDVSAQTFTSQIRPSPGGALIESFAVDDSDANIGELVVSLTAAKTDAIVAGEYVWDLRGVDGGEVLTLIAGVVTVVAAVTELGGS